jgi:calcineurin-like phosphoesterase family protein
MGGKLMAEVFLISDTHFGHNNIIKYCNRPYENVDEMDSALIKNWNSVVGPNDKVYHLGDLTMNPKHLWIMDHLNGTKILIKGNHDIFPIKEYLPHFKDIRGSHSIAEMLLTHIPVNKQQSSRYKANVHGHLHDKLIKDNWYINVSVEQINYTPIALDDVIAKARKIKVK